MFTRWTLGLILYAVIMRHCCPQLVDIINMRAVTARLEAEVRR
jgi:hypothetical protein